MLKFKDFAPKQLQQAGFLKRAEYASFETAVEAADQWIESSSVKIINLETVVLPNIWKEDEDGTSDSALLTGGETSSTWYQFVRCWYQE